MKGIPFVVVCAEEDYEAPVTCRTLASAISLAKKKADTYGLRFYVLAAVGYAEEPESPPIEYTEL